MRAIVTAAVGALLVAPVPSLAQSGAISPDASAERFFTTLKAGKVDEALRELTSRSKLLSTRLAGEPAIGTQIEGALKLYGPVSSWERVESQVLGTTARRDVYLVRHRDMVTRWRIFHVQTSGGWMVASFNFDDQISNWFPSTN